MAPKGRVADWATNNGLGYFLRLYTTKIQSPLLSPLMVVVLELIIELLYLKSANSEAGFCNFCPEESGNPAEGVNDNW